MPDRPPARSTAAPATDRTDQRPGTLDEQLRELRRTVESLRLVRDTWTAIIAVVAAFALLLSVIAIGFGMRAIDEAESASAAPAVAVTDGGGG
ncbi:MAG: hypothetical protein ACLGI8_05790 [Acidimicrobiia bacterium]